MPQSAAPKKKNVQRRLKGRGDYSEEINKTVDPLKRLESKLDHIERTMFRPPKVSEAAGSVGRAIGNRFGAGDLGASAATGLAKLFGMGDYTIKSNSLVKGSVSGPLMPTFGTDRRTVRIAEREYIGDVFSGALSAGSSAYTNRSYAINPSDPNTFPWLSKFAALFDQWLPHGIVFEFVSTSSEYNGTSQALGKVVMATDYDPNDAPYASSQVAENADYSCVTKPSSSLVHGIECDPDDRITRILYVKGAPTKLELTSLGNFQLSTSGCSTAGTRLGELWVSYDISFLKKQVPTLADTSDYLCVAGGTVIGGSLFSNASVLSTSNTISITQTAGVSSNIVLPPNQGAGRYLVTYYTTSPNAADAPVNTVTNGVATLGRAAGVAPATRIIMFIVDVTAPGCIISSNVSAANSTYAMSVEAVPNDYSI